MHGEGSIEIMEDNSVVFATGSVTGAVFISRYDDQLNMMWNRILEVDEHYIYTPILKINENQDIIVGADLSMKTTHEKALALITVTKNGQLSTNWTLQKIYCPLFSIALEEEPVTEVASVARTHTTTRVYPKPSKGLLKVELSDLFNPEKRIALSIVNMLGQEVKSFETLNHRMNLNLSDLPHGQYILLVRQQDTMDQLKILIH